MFIARGIHRNAMQLITQKAKRGGKATSGSMSNKMENGQILSKNVVSNSDGTFTVPSQRTSCSFIRSKGGSAGVDWTPAHVLTF